MCNNLFRYLPTNFWRSKVCRLKWNIDYTFQNKIIDDYLKLLRWRSVDRGYIVLYWKHGRLIVIHITCLIFKRAPVCNNLIKLGVNVNIHLPKLFNDREHKLICRVGQSLYLMRPEPVCLSIIPHFPPDRLQEQNF